MIVDRPSSERPIVLRAKIRWVSDQALDTRTSRRANSLADTGLYMACCKHRHTKKFRLDLTLNKFFNVKPIYALNQLTNQ